MSTHPIDVLAQAIRVADGTHTLGAGQLAEVVAEALTDEAIVDNAVEALVAAGWGVFDGWSVFHGSALLNLSREELNRIARVVLGSVGGR